MSTKYNQQLWVAGYRAHGVRVPLDQCPHSDASKAHHWKKGWQTARDDHQVLAKQREQEAARNKNF